MQGRGEGQLIDEHEWNRTGRRPEGPQGARDPAAYLSVPAAIQFPVPPSLRS